MRTRLWASSPRRSRPASRRTRPADGRVFFHIRTAGEHFRTAPRARAFAEAILSFVDRTTVRPAPILDERGQAADLGGYEPQNR